MKTVLIVPLLLLANGCAAYTEAQMRLAEEARRGLGQARQSHAQRQAVIEQYHQLQRRQIDEAFDRDVRETVELEPDWVIEHRRAYAATIDLLHRQQSATAAAGDAARRNFDAIDAALERLMHLQSLQSNLFVLDK